VSTALSSVAHVGVSPYIAPPVETFTKEVAPERTAKSRALAVPSTITRR